MIAAKNNHRQNFVRSILLELRMKYKILLYVSTKKFYEWKTYTNSSLTQFTDKEIYNINYDLKLRKETIKYIILHLFIHFFKQGDTEIIRCIEDHFRVLTENLVISHAKQSGLLFEKNELKLFLDEEWKIFPNILRNCIAEEEKSLQNMIENAFEQAFIQYCQGYQSYLELLNSDNFLFNFLSQSCTSE